MLEEYTMEETKQQQGRSPDSLIQAIDRIERLEKQLKIAMLLIQKLLGFFMKTAKINNNMLNKIGEALEEIKELEK